MATLAVATLAAVNPVGWDRYGPIRWMLIPGIGFALAALSVDRVTITGRGAGRARPADDGPKPRRGDRWWLDRVIAVAWCGLLGWGAVAAALAADPLHAWIGSPDRRFGWLTWLLCGGLFLVGSTSGPTLDRATRRGVVVGTILLGGWTLAEWTGALASVGLAPQFASGRLGGPFGQPAYLGAAAALATPVTLGVALAAGSGGVVGDQDREADDHPTDRWRTAATLATTLGIGALLLAQSRAAWLGALVGIATSAAVATVSSRRAGGSAAAVAARSGTRRWPVGAAVAGPLALIAAVPTLRARLVGAMSPGGVVDGRLDEWRIGLRALGASPLAGHGPEGYRTVFGAHVDRDYVLAWGRDVITDRAHGGLLDTALAFGLPGGALALILLVAVGWSAVRVLARGDPAGVGLAVGVLAYAVGQQFLFPLAELDPLFWLLAGLLTARARDTAPAPSRGRSVGARAAVAGVLAGLAAVSGLAGLADVVADIDVAQALDADPARRPGLAQRLRPDSIRYDFVASRIVANRSLGQALAHLDSGLRRSPDDPALRGERAALLVERARAVPEGPGREEALAVAVDELRRLVDTDPLHPLHLQRLGVALALSGRLGEAEATLQSALDLAPDDAAARTNLDLVEELIDGSRGSPPDSPSDGSGG